tara:strand:+ start:166 stop:591 length:426 start_codon:yes stop_codon:yes gene_type:complete
MIVMEISKTPLARLSQNLPEFCKSHWLLRVPISVVFIQQGLSKIPVTLSAANSFDLPYSVWFFVAWGELTAGLGLLLGGLLERSWLGDLITRVSGIIITGIMAGVFLIGEPDSILDVVLYDQFHLMLLLGGLFFLLRGNRV